jgi:hypothetical protein
MSLQKSKILLDKITALHHSIAADGKVSSIERDLMLSYLRQMYETFIDIAEDTAIPMPPPPAPKVAEPIERPTPPPAAPVVMEYVVTPTTPVAEPREQPKPTPPPPPIVETPAPKVEVVEVVAEVPKPTPPPVVQPPVNIFPEPPKPRAAQKPLIKLANERVDQSELFEEKMKKELSDKLGETPLDDIRKGMGLNEKMLILNELFDGKHQEFDDAVHTLNTIGSFESAKNVLATLSQRFDWASKEKFAKPFIRLVRRRYN